MKIKGFLKYHLKDRVTLLQKWVQLKLWKSPPILVFTMAKVGSLSIYFSLKKFIPRTAIFHIHSLNEHVISNNDQLCFDNGIYPGSRSPVPLINTEIINNKRPFQIISLFRDPIERNISAFFEAFELYVGVSPEKYTGTIEELIDEYHAKLPHHYAINWFDTHLLESTGIDVYQTSFNHKKGTMVLTQDHVSILVLSSAMSDDAKATSISEFTKQKSIQINNRNITANSDAAELYTRFKNTIKFDEEYLNQMYKSKFAIHFFTESHRLGAFKKWKKA